MVIRVGSRNARALIERSRNHKHGLAFSTRLWIPGSLDPGARPTAGRHANDLTLESRSLLV